MSLDQKRLADLRRLAEATTPGRRIAVLTRAQAGATIAHFGPSWCDSFPAATDLRAADFDGRHVPGGWEQHAANAALAAALDRETVLALLDAAEMGETQDALAATRPVVTHNGRGTFYAERSGAVEIAVLAGDTEEIFMQRAVCAFHACTRKR